MTDDRIDQHIADLPAVVPGGAAAAEAFQSLLSAQLTAEERLQGAEGEARHLIAAAEAAAARTMQSSSGRVSAIHHRARSVLAESRAETARATREADRTVQAATSAADTIVASATASAEETVAEALHSTEQLRRQAVIRHQELVGELQTRRDALRLSTAALERFESHYRVRLTAMIEAELPEVQPR